MRLPGALEIRARPASPWVVVPAALVLLSTTWSDPDSGESLGIRSVELTETVRLDIPPGKRTTALWIPRPPSDSYQTVELLGVDSPWPSHATADPDFGNPLLYFEAKSPSAGTVDIRLRYRTRREQAWPVPGKEPVPAIFRKPRGLIVIDDEVRRLSRQATRGLTDPLEKARALYRQVLRRMSYDTRGTGWGRGDVVYACKVGKGNCTDFHSLFIALALSEGIPARFRMGYPLPEAQEGAVLKPYHCWAEFHIAARGWIPIDISEAWKHPARAAYYFGHLDPDRVLVSTGRGIRLPGSRGPPLNYLIRPFAEADGKPFYAMTFERRYKSVRGGNMRTMLAVPLSLALASAVPSWAGEHPKEHPTAAPAQKQEHPKEHPAGHEHPVGSQAWNKQMRQEFSKAVEDYVDRRTAAEGAFKVKDDKLGKEWALKLVGVHKKRIVNLGGQSFFACADFKTVSGGKAKLDLDFYATKGPEGWRIDKTVIHKVDGKPRYTYNEKNEMVPVLE